MRIEELDKNLKVETTITEPDLIWLDARTAPLSLHGVFYDEAQGCYVRLPQQVADQANPGLARLNANTAGGRLRFRTDSAFIGIRVVQPENGRMVHMPPSGQSGFDLYRKTGAATAQYVHTFMPPVEPNVGGYSSGYSREGEMADFTLNFPLYDGVKELYIAFKKGARIEAPTPYTYQKPVVYYGSSITQGGCASRPGNSYQGFISQWLDTEYINLGFSGSCRAEPAMAEYIASLDMSVFVYDYDHNCDSSEHLRATHLPLYRVFREKQPDTPIIFVSAPTINMRGGDFVARRQVVLDTYNTAVAEGDQNVCFVDGATIFDADWDACTMDGCHPNDLGFYRMAKHIGDAVKSVLK